MGISGDGLFDEGAISGEEEIVNVYAHHAPRQGRLYPLHCYLPWDQGDSQWLITSLSFPLPALAGLRRAFLEIGVAGRGRKCTDLPSLEEGPQGVLERLHARCFIL